MREILCQCPHSRAIQKVPFEKEKSCGNCIGPKCSQNSTSGYLRIPFLIYTKTRSLVASAFFTKQAGLRDLHQLELEAARKRRRRRKRKRAHSEKSPDNQAFHSETDAMPAWHHHRQMEMQEKSSHITSNHVQVHRVGLEI